MVLFFVAVADFARLYTTMTTIESAAREAADYGSFDSSYWTDPTSTQAQMTHRACMASSNRRIRQRRHSDMFEPSGLARAPTG
jgi:hypothetical protein